MLVLEDDEDVAGMVGTALAQRGHSVTLVGSVVAAVHAMLGDEYDAGLFDVMVPGPSGMDGLSVAAAFRRSCPSAGVVVVTALDPSQSQRQMVEGLDGILLRKPCPLYVLADAVECSGA